MEIRTILYFNIFSNRSTTNIRRRNDDVNKNPFSYTFSIKFNRFLINILYAKSLGTRF